MKISTQRIYTSDNLELFGLLYEPDMETKNILVHVHGMAGNFYENKFLDHLSVTLTNNGIAFFAFNNRGCEYIKDLYKVVGERRNTVRYGDTYEKFEDCLLDIKSAIDFAQKRGFASIHLSGHSLGGPKVAYYMSETQDQRVRSVIFLSPADMVGLAKGENDYDVDIKIAREMIADGKGGDIMPKLIWDESFLTANTYMSLSDEHSKVAIFNLYDPADSLSVLSKISVPAITIMGKKDGALSVPIEQLMARVKSALSSSKLAETVVLGDANHQYDGYETQLAETVSGWIKRVA